MPRLKKGSPEAKAWGEEMKAKRAANKEETAGGIPQNPSSITGPGPEPISVPPKDESETVAVKKSFLEELQKTLESNQKDIQLLKSVADKRALARYYERNRKEVPPVVRVRTLDIRDVAGNAITKIVMGWRTIKDEVFKDPRSQKWVEEQIVEILFQDGKTQQMTLLDFNRRFQHIRCNRVGTITDETTKQMALKLMRLDNGEELVIGVQFVN